MSGVLNLRAFNVAFSSIPTAPTNLLLLSTAYQQLGSNSSTRLQLNLLATRFDAFRVRFNSTSLRISYNVAVNPKRGACIGMAHLFLHNARCRAVVQHGTCRPVPSGVKPAVIS
jgi:hypothetical protein